MARSYPGKFVSTTIHFTVAMTKPNLRKIGNQLPTIIQDKRHNVIYIIRIGYDIYNSFCIQFNLNTIKVTIAANKKAIFETLELSNKAIGDPNFSSIPFNLVTMLISDNNSTTS